MLLLLGVRILLVTYSHLRLSNVEVCSSSVENLIDVPVLHHCLEQLKLDQLAIRRVMAQCMMFYKIHNGLMNINFPSNLKMRPASERSGHHLRYDPVLASRNTYKYSFFIRTIPTWNRLPPEAVAALTTNSRQWICQQFWLCSPLLLII